MSKRVKSNPVFVGATTNATTTITLTCKSDDGTQVRVLLSWEDAFKMVTDVLTLLLTSRLSKKGGGH